MKKIILTLLALSLLSQIVMAEEGTLSSRIKLKGASDISKRANGEDGYTQGLDPITNSMMGGMTQMMQGMTGNFSNIHMMQEQTRLQQDYLRQATPEVSDDE